MTRMTWRTASMLVGIIASPTMAAPGFAPGQWQHQTTLLTADVPGVPQWIIKMMAGHGRRESCATPALLGSHPETLLQGDDTAICKTRTFTLSSGKLTYDTFCTNKRFPAGLLVESRGSYTPISYTISTISTGTKNGSPVRIETRGTGNRISATCKG